MNILSISRTHDHPVTVPLSGIVCQSITRPIPCQYHKWLPTEQVQALLKCYFSFFITYKGKSVIGLFVRIKAEIEKELLLDRNLINDTFLPVVSYNRAAMGDRFVEHKATVCLPAIIAWQLRLPQSFVAHPDRLHIPKYAFLTPSSSRSSSAVPLRVIRPTSRI